MAKKTKAQQAALLNSIVNDTKGPQGYSLVHSDDVKALVEAGHIEVNHTITDPSGKIAARATAKLLESNGATADATGADSAPTSTFVLESGIPLPPAQKGGRRDEQYPFSKMEVGQSFFVPVTAKYPKPWETFGSTVSSATRRFSNEHPTDKRKNRKGVEVPVLVATRKFTLRQVTAGQKYANGFEEKAGGARVYRIA
jgi:hypothetical protein